MELALLNDLAPRIHRCELATQPISRAPNNVVSPAGPKCETYAMDSRLQRTIKKLGVHKIRLNGSNLVSTSGLGRNQCQSNNCRWGRTPDKENLARLDRLKQSLDRDKSERPSCMRNWEVLVFRKQSAPLVRKRLQINRA